MKATIEHINQLNLLAGILNGYLPEPEGMIPMIRQRRIMQIIRKRHKELQHQIMTDTCVPLRNVSFIDDDDLPGWGTEYDEPNERQPMHDMDTIHEIVDHWSDGEDSRYTY